eukprot:scaffold113130_cov31-Tisochrysis_lutea.AAC.8
MNAASESSRAAAPRRIFSNARTMKAGRASFAFSTDGRRASNRTIAAPACNWDTKRNASVSELQCGVLAHARIIWLASCSISAAGLSGRRLLIRIAAARRVASLRAPPPTVASCRSAARAPGCDSRCFRHCSAASLLSATASSVPLSVASSSAISTFPLLGR